MNPILKGVLWFFGAAIVSYLVMIQILLAIDKTADLWGI